MRPVRSAPVLGRPDGPPASDPAAGFPRLPGEHHRAPVRFVDEGGPVGQRGREPLFGDHHARVERGRGRQSVRAGRDRGPPLLQARARCPHGGRGLPRPVRVRRLKQQGADLVLDAIDSHGNARLCQAVDEVGARVTAKVTDAQHWTSTVAEDYKDAPHCRNAL